MSCTDFAKSASLSPLRLRLVVPAVPAEPNEMIQTRLRELLRIGAVLARRGWT